MNLKITKPDGSEEIIAVEKYEEVQSGRFKPKMGERFWTNDFIAISPHWCLWGDSSYDKAKLSLGLCFRTEEECQAYINYQQVVVRVNDKIDELNKGWVADWGDGSEYKWSIFYDGDYGSEATSSFNHPTILHKMKSDRVSNSIISPCKEDLDIIFNYKR